ncbi:Hsp20 family protein [Streptomyces sp. NPDC093600]|uniref:Hsp20 family protein n=1 Tax=Streptomyces sp. NPDC093600 TaxID=3366047 RepID=UPI003813B25D
MGRPAASPAPRGRPPPGRRRHGPPVGRPPLRPPGITPRKEPGNRPFPCTSRAGIGGAPTAICLWEVLVRGTSGRCGPASRPECFRKEMIGMTLPAHRERTAPMWDPLRESVDLRDRMNCQFDYRVTLPQDSDAENVSAELAEGVPTIRVPKARKAKPRRIEIRGRRGRTACARPARRAGGKRSPWPVSWSRTRMWSHGCRGVRHSSPGGRRYGCLSPP